jgi:hypothetical protein
MATTAKSVAKTANALPEYITQDSSFITVTLQALSARANKAQYEAQEKEAKEGLATQASALRQAQAESDNYIGLVRVVQPESATKEMPPIRIEFKLASKDSALKMTELDTVNELFGGLRPQLFEPVKIVTEIHDPQALYEALKSAGHNPWDYLSLSVKDGMDNIISQHPGATTVEALMPKTGFLARLQEFGKNLSDDAKYYIRRYLERALSSAVTLGSRGKAS